MDRRILVAVFVALCAFQMLRIVTALGAPDLFTDVDDIMRMVSVRDLLGGQAFNDTIQYRDNTPFGTAMHWSHLIDLPLAGIVALVRPLGEGLAMTIAEIAWPTLLLVGMTGLCVALSVRLAGRMAMLPALVLPMLSVPVLTEFAPGRVDHHNVQMLLSTGLALALMGARTGPRAALIAGLLAGASLAIGLETLAFVVLAIAIMALFLVFAPADAARPARWFALAFAGSTCAFFVVTVRPDFYAQAACDALSVTYVVASMAAAAVLFLGSLACIRFRSSPIRFALLAALGAVAIGVVLVLFPHCMRGPYAELDPVLEATMFPFIEEAQPLLKRLVDAPAAALSFSLMPLIGLGVTIWLAIRTRGANRLDWLVLLAFAIVAIAVMTLQVRAARLAAPFAIPPGAWLISAAWLRFRASNSLPGAAKVVAVCLGFASIIHLSLAIPAQAFLMARGLMPIAYDDALPAACFKAEGFAALAALPSSRLMIQSQLGTHALRLTSHSVVATGYHRNSDGMADVAAFFGADPLKAREIAAHRGLDYAVACRTAPEVAGFLARVGTDPAWTWLTPISDLDATLQIFWIE